MPRLLARNTHQLGSSSPHQWLKGTSHILKHPITQQKFSQAICLVRQVQLRPIHESRRPCRSAVTDMTQGDPSITSSAASTKTKLRILCLHGYLQNSEVFSGKIGSMRKALKSRGEFIFMNAPHEAQGEEAESRAAGGTGEHPKTWWHWEDVESTKRPSKAAQYTGWEASSSSISEALQKEHPIDGILGFSQGAVAAALFLAEMRAHNQQSGLKFAILISSFMPKDERYADLLDRKCMQIGLPTLFVHGLQDELVPLAQGEIKQSFVKFLDAAAG